MPIIHPTLSFSPLNDDWVDLTDDLKQFPNSVTEWLEDLYTDANGRARKVRLDGKPFIEMFKSVAFNKTDLESIIGQIGCATIIFTHINVETTNGKLNSTLLAVGVDSSLNIMVQPNHKMFIATDTTLPHNTGWKNISIEGVTPPFHNTRDFVWNTDITFEKDKLTEILNKLREGITDGVPGHINVFASVSFNKQDLRDVMREDDCEKVCFMPLVNTCTVRENIGGETEVSVQEDITLMAIGIDANKRRLPFKGQNNKVAYSQNPWPPNYPHWR